MLIRVIQGVLIGIVATLGAGWVFAPVTWAISYPILAGWFVGMILGDPMRGAAAGAYINLAYMGWISAGGSMPGNMMIAGVYGTALTVLAAADPKLAPTLAVPLGLFGVAVWNVQMSVNAAWIHRADRYAEEGNTRGILLMNFVPPQIVVFLLNGLPAVILLLAGPDFFKSLLEKIPANWADAMGVVASLMPALGIAMLINYLRKPKLLPIFFIGYFVAIYLKLNIMALAVFGGLIGLFAFLNQPQPAAAAVATAEKAQPKLEKQLTKRDLVTHWLMGLCQESCYNYERLQAVGTCAAMVPMIRKFYKTKEEIAARLKCYMVFFNTEPAFIGTVIPGIVASMEEQRANGAPITDDEINSVRSGLMGPLAGIGDTVSQAITYPTLAAICIDLALRGNPLAAPLFWVGFTGIMLVLGYNLYMRGYYQGRQVVTQLLRGNLLSRVTDAFAIMGLMVVGGMAAQRIPISIPLSFTVSGQTLAVQTMLDSLMPGLIPLAIVLITYQLVRRRISMTRIVTGMFFVGLVLGLLKIFKA
jgi:PTS system mannose-specific IID component